MSAADRISLCGPLILLACACSDYNGFPPAGADRPGGTTTKASQMARPTPTDAKQRCSPAPASFSIGKRHSSTLIERARVASGAPLVRVLQAGVPHTLEYRPDRLNLRVDSGGRILEVTCG